MKRLLVHIFQLVCFIQIIGYGQLHAHTNLYIENAHPGKQALTISENPVQAIVHRTTHQHLKHSSSNSQLVELLLIEDLDSDEDENEKRSIEDIQLISKAYFFNWTTVDLDQFNKSKRHFIDGDKHSSENRKFILFQVFRL